MSKHISAHLANKYLLSIYYVSSTEMPVAKKAHRILSEWTARKGVFQFSPRSLLWISLRPWLLLPSFS